MRHRGMLTGLLPFFWLCASSHAGQPLPMEFEGVGIKENLGAQVSLSTLHFKNESGQEVALSSLFKPGKPVILNLVYYKCPSLCGLVLNGLLDGLKKFAWNVGDKFQVITLSIDPTEGPDLAKKKKDNFLSAYGRRGAEQGWSFLTGREEDIKSLATQIGFGYRYDEIQKQYAHGAAIFVLTAEGKISRYLYGIEYPEQSLRLALLEASNGKIGTIVDRILLFCYRYDPQARNYAFYAMNIVRFVTGALMAGMAGFYFLFWRRQRRLTLKGVG